MIWGIFDMAWIKRIKGESKGGSKKKRVLVIGLDGVPYTFLTHPKNAGKFPRMQELFQNGAFQRMRSVIPTISSVAWSSFMTGRNPAKHNIYGFIDRKANPFEPFIPTASNMKSSTLWQILSQAQKRVVVINVPVTYPPKPVNGILVGCFLATKLDKAAYPASVVPKLKELGYVIDVDAWLARKDRKKFLEELHVALDRRVATARYFLEQEEWDFFQVHVMETDRINHFFWEAWENGHPEFAPEFIRYYQKIDDYVGQIHDQFVEQNPETEFILLSDHGFCSIRQEVFVNQWLCEKGFLKFTGEKPDLKQMHPETTAYSLIPGRIFLNVRGREYCGRIEPGENYEKTCQQLAGALMEMKDPANGEPILDRVVRRDEIYHGPYLDQAADLVAVPRDGYDLKGNIDQTALTGRSELEGMHTYDDAFFYLKGKSVNETGFDIHALAPTILKLMDVPIPADMDRGSLPVE
ncbi:MAG: alkaline phosphatase family protein [bacterium]